MADLLYPLPAPEMLLDRVWIPSRVLRTICRLGIFADPIYTIFGKGREQIQWSNSMASID